MTMTTRAGLLAGRKDRYIGPAGPNIALVLSGGSTHGAAQVGQIRALMEAGLVPDVIIGCSVGALNGVGLAANPTMSGVDALEAGWRSMRSGDMFPLRSGRTLARIVAGKDYICPSGPLRESVARICPHADLGDLRVPVHVATTDLDDSQTRWWSAGPTVDVVAASAAIPGLFPPVRIAGHRHVDGGVLAPVPVRRAVELGAAHIFVSDVSSRDRTEHGAFGVLIEAFNVARYAGSGLPVTGPGQRIAVLPTPPTDGISLTDFAQTGRLISQAYDRTRGWLAELVEWAGAAGGAGASSPAGRFRLAERAHLSAWIHSGGERRRAS